MSASLTRYGVDHFKSPQPLAWFFFVDGVPVYLPTHSRSWTASRI